MIKNSIIFIYFFITHIYLFNYDINRFKNNIDMIKYIQNFV